MKLNKKRTRKWQCKWDFLTPKKNMHQQEILKQDLSKNVEKHLKLDHRIKIDTLKALWVNEKETQQSSRFMNNLDGKETIWAVRNWELILG